MRTADVFVYYFATQHDVQSVPDAPSRRNNWQHIQDVVSYYMSRGWRLA